MNIPGFIRPISGNVPPPVSVGEPTQRRGSDRLINHEIQFKIHNSFNASNLEDVCKKWVNQINSVFSKTTNRRFIYSGFELVDTWPYSGSGSIELPDRGFKIIVYIVPPAPSIGGTCLIEGDDTIAVINTSTLSDSSNIPIVIAICHEIAHGFGVAVGEYFSIRFLIDFTGVLPEFKVCDVIPDDYWHTPEHIDWLDDPMLSYNPTNPKFCWLSSYLINSGKYRSGQPPLPDLNSVSVKLINKSIPIDSSHEVMVWKNSRVSYDKIGTYHTNNDGVFSFPWNAGNTNHWTEALSDNFRIIKVLKNGQPVMATGLSIWDVEESYIKSDFSSSYQISLKSS